jgi:hypothetical protein
MNPFEKTMIYVHLSITLVGAFLLHPGLSERHVSKKHKTIQIDTLKVKR